MTPDEMTVDELRAQLKQLLEEREKQKILDEIDALQGDDELMAFVHPPQRIDPKVRATFEQAAKVAEELNKIGYMGHETWHPHGHMANGAEVCELHTHGSTEKLSKWGHLG